MSSIAAVRAGIGNQLDLISSLNVYDTIPDSIIVPCAIVGMPSTIEYDFAFRSPVAKMQIPVRVYTGPVLEQEAQTILDDYVSADGVSSVRAAIDLDPTLGAVAQTTRVLQAQGYGAYEMAGVQYLGVEFLLEVVA